MILIVGSGCGLLRDPSEASAPIEALPLEAEGAAKSGEANSEPIVYTIVPAASEVRFELDEDLRGQRQTVVGATNQVAGEIAVAVADLSTVQVGVIQINARTLLTDNTLRNRAIQNEILETGRFEFISFAPSGIQNLPGSVDLGEEVLFKVTGDLTIRDITQQVSFEVIAKVASESHLEGTASAVVDRESFGLVIPSVPNVANVEQEVELYIDFVAEAQ